MHRLQSLSFALVVTALTSATAFAAEERPKVLVMELKANGVDENVARTFKSLLTVELSQVGAFDVISDEDVKRLVELEADKQAAGCTDESCLSEIAGALGAELVVFGDAGKIGETLVFQVSLFDARKAKSVSRIGIKTKDLDAVPAALTETLDELVGPASPAAARAEVATSLRARATELEEAADARAVSAAEREAKAKVAAEEAEAKARQELALAGPSGPRLFVVDPHLVNMSDAVKKTVVASVGQAAQDQGLAVFTKDDARQVLTQASDLALLGGDADGPSLAELGKKVGVPHVVAATVSAIDDDTVVQMRLIDTDKSAVIARRELKLSESGDGLVDGVKRATGLVLAPIFSHLKGEVALDVTEEGANVYLDDALIGVTPLGAFSVPGGMREIEVAKEGFIRHAETVRITRGATVAREVTLRPSVEFATDYANTNGLLRTLAWTSSGLTLVFAAVGGAAGGVWGYKRFVYDDALDKSIRARIEEEQITDAQQVNALEDELVGERNLTALVGTAGVVVGALAVSAGVFAAGFWVFGEDPSRYDAFLVDAE